MAQRSAARLAAATVLIIGAVMLASSAPAGVSAARPSATRCSALTAGKQRLRYPSGPSGPSYPYPGAPGGWGPSPPKHGDEELPLTSGMVVNIQSVALSRFCNVGPADAKPVPYPLRCLENGTSMVSQGLLLIGKDYVTSKLFDGSVVQLKAQRENKVCSYGAEEDRFPVSCGGMDTGPTSDFVIKRAPGHPDLYLLAPAIIPSHKCYPASAPGTDEGDPAAQQHLLVCDGQARGDAALLAITQADFWAPPSTGGNASSKQGPVSAVLSWLSSLLAPARTSAGCSHRDQGHASSGTSRKQAMIGSMMGVPGGPAAPDAPDAPGAGPAPFPFRTGSMILLADPSSTDVGGPVCDVLSTEGPDDDDDARQVTCDHDPPAPNPWYIASGFLVLGVDHQAQEIGDGTLVHLKSMSTKRYCVRSAEPNGVMTCGGNKTQSVFRLEAVDAAPEPSASSSSSSALKAKAKVEEDDFPLVEAHLQDVASGRYCAVDSEDFTLPLACDFVAEVHGRPKVLIKVAKSAWP